TTTDDLGYLNLIVGDGLVITGDISTIDWSQQYDLEVVVSANGGAINITDQRNMNLVPYAKYADKAARADSALFATTAGNVNDADADPTNEIQNLSLVLDTVFLTGGGFVKLPASIGATGATGATGADGNFGAPGQVG